MMNTIVKKFHDDYIKIKEDDKEYFKEVFQLIMSKGFIVKTLAEKQYNFIMANEELFKSFFSLIGFEFKSRYDLETHYIKSDNNLFAKNIRKNDTIILLILRLLYEDLVEKVTLNEHVEIKYYELEQKLLEVGFEDVYRERVRTSSIIDSLRLFRNHNIISFKVSGLNDNTVITIYPSIEVVFDFADVENVLNRVNEIAPEGDIDETDED